MRKRSGPPETSILDSGRRSTALFLSPEAPYPLAGGGALRSASLLHYLGRRHKVDAILFRQHGEPDPAGSIPPGLVGDTLTLELPRHSRSPLTRVARTVSRSLRGVPPLSDRFSGFQAPIREFLRGRSYDVALIEHLWCAPYWEQAAPVSRRVVLDLHNVESLLMARRAEVAGVAAGAVFRRFARASLRLERLWLPRYSLVLAVSEPDSDAIRAASPTSRVLVYPNALPWIPLPQCPAGHVIAFSGNLEYDPNADAVRYFHRSIWPLLRRRWPRLIWRLIGKNPEAVRRWVDGDPHVELAGPPADATRALAACQVIVAPLRAGSGTRVKILEAWAAGRPVVSTTVGAEGLPARGGVNILLADRPEDFAAAVSGLLESAEQSQRLGAAGRSSYERGFTWESAWAGLGAAGF